MSDEKRIDELFWKGVDLFNSGDFYDAHEEWEELWSEFNLPDRFFIQGLIQTTVSFYHLSTANLKGARNLMGRALDKLTRKGPDGGRWQSQQRGVETSIFIDSIERCGEKMMTIKSSEDFDWSLVPNLLPSRNIINAKNNP